MPRDPNTYIDLTPEERLELLPCPWCGKPNYDDMDEENYLIKVIERNMWYSIRCHGCGANPRKYANSFQEAISAWNNRTVLEETVQYLNGINAARRDMQAYLSELSLFDGHYDD